jgi:type II secretory pathway pseudopilin PulG
MPRPRRLANDQGETLIELIIAVAIMGIAMVSIVSGIGTSILMSDVHRKQATAGAYVRDYAEKVETYVAGAGYTPCAPASTYTPSTVGFALPSGGYSAAASAALSWNGSAWVACSADNGYQKVTLIISNNDGRASESLDVVLRRPCRTSDWASSPCT